MGESILILYNPTSTSPSRALLPMSLLALGAVLEGKYRYEIVDGNLLGNPPDPELDVELTTNFIRRLKKVNPATEIILYTYTPVPQNASGTGLPEHAKAAGFKFPTTLDDWVGDTWQTFALRREPDTPWCDRNIYRQLRNFERVVNAYYPTTTDMKLTRVRKGILKAFGGWRYHLRFYNYPVELRVLQKVFSYQRLDTTGF